MRLDHLLSKEEEVEEKPAKAEHYLIIRVHREYPHRMLDRHREKSLLFGKWMEGRMYGTNVPDIEMKRSGIEI